MNKNSYIGRTYEAKCGCKYAIKNVFVEVNELKLKESKMMVELYVDSYCEKDHKTDITPPDFHTGH